tara:strand:- start:272 stop:499 length:228 start_codon:yes stop_codon:yes gene_type:complete
MKKKKSVTIFDKKARPLTHHTRVLELRDNGSNWTWSSKQNSLAEVRQNTLALQVQLSNLLQSVQVNKLRSDYEVI